MRCPEGDFRFSVMPRLPRFTDMKFAPRPSTTGSHLRFSSPPRSSTLITSAPRSAKSCPQDGPARTRLRSSTRMPWSAVID